MKACTDPQNTTLVLYSLYYVRPEVLLTQSVGRFTHTHPFKSQHTSFNKWLERAYLNNEPGKERFRSPKTELETQNKAYSPKKP